MKELDQNNLDTAIALGDSVCKELGICCETRGRVIFQIYKRLEELKPQKGAGLTQQTSKSPDELNTGSMEGASSTTVIDGGDTK